MAFILTNTQKARVSVTPVNRHGGPAELDSLPVWKTSDETVVFLADFSEDGLSATVFAAGGLGSAQIQVSADADLDDEEVREIVGTLDIQVVAAEAASFLVTAGLPEEV